MNIQLIKKIGNVSLFSLLLGVAFVPELKAGVQQTLMKTGLFQPQLPTTEIKAEKDTVSTAGNFTMNLKDQSGKTVTLDDLKGKVVFINFWATWCAPCIAEMPSIQNLYDKFKENDDVAFVILEAEGSKDKAEKFMERKKLTLPVYYPAGTIPQEFFRGRLPTTVILDKQGNIAHITEGMADYSGQDIVDFLNEVRAMHP